MKHNLIFGNVNSNDHFVFITGSGTFSAPQRDVEYVSVSGRNGDLVIDNGKWNNIRVTYPASIPDDFEENMSAFREKICKLKGYQKLEDSYHPDEYRLAVFADGLEPRTTQRNRGGTFDISFNCKPQRFLKSGDEPIQFMPPSLYDSDLRSQYIPVAGDLHFDVNCVSTDTITVTVVTYDASYTQLTSTQYTCSNRDSEDVTFANTDKFFQIRAAGYTSGNLDKTWLQIRTVTSYDGETIPINAIFGRKWTMINPTGYASKPMIEVYGNSIPYIDIVNTDGDVTELYVFRSNAVTGVHHLWLDCDMQYMYDDNKVNRTDKFIISTAHSSLGNALVFPELGSNEISLQMYMSGSSTEYGIGLMNIYPRWWKL